jgi:hypothetical protein
MGISAISAAFQTIIDPLKRHLLPQLFPHLFQRRILELDDQI